MVWPDVFVLSLFSLSGTGLQPEAVSGEIINKKERRNRKVSERMEPL